MKKLKILLFTIISSVLLATSALAFPFPFCYSDLKICLDGSSVGRDGLNGCAFKACPAPEVSEPFPPITGRFCAMDAKMCLDGSYVSRDSDNGCAFKACPVVTAPINTGDYDSDNNSSSNTCFNLSRSIKYLSKDANTGGEVSDLQAFLQDKGYLSQDPSGYFGKVTLEAVKRYQAFEGLDQTGYVGIMTRAKIKIRSCISSEDNNFLSGATSITGVITSTAQPEPVTKVITNTNPSVSAYLPVTSYTTNSEYGLDYTATTNSVVNRFLNFFRK